MSTPPDFSLPSYPIHRVIPAHVLRMLNNPDINQLVDTASSPIDAIAMTQPGYGANWTLIIDEKSVEVPDAELVMIGYTQYLLKYQDGGITEFVRLGDGNSIKYEGTRWYLTMPSGKRKQIFTATPLYRRAVKTAPECPAPSLTMPPNTVAMSGASASALLRHRVIPTYVLSKLDNPVINKLLDEASPPIVAVAMTQPNLRANWTVMIGEESVEIPSARLVAINYITQLLKYRDGEFVRLGEGDSITLDGTLCFHNMQSGERRQVFTVAALRIMRTAAQRDVDASLKTPTRSAKRRCVDKQPLAPASIASSAHPPVVASAEHALHDDAHSLSPGSPTHDSAFCDSMTHRRILTGMHCKWVDSRYTGHNEEREADEPTRFLYSYSI
ncbi:MAG: hypothetical protein KBD64_02140 [Gammaproteobacteria bacterium]|nr:hypothetical protein [Gammaproteobacteria bacterium]